VYSNIRSIYKNFDNVESFLLNSNFDIVALCECWISTNPYIPLLSGFNYKFVPSGFGKSGGIIVYYKSYLSIELINIATPSNDAQLEILPLNIINKNITLTVIYRHPKGNGDCFIEDLENLLTQKDYQCVGKNNIFCGDFNINLLKKSKLLDSYTSLIHAFDYNFHIHDATRITSNSATCIDHVFSNCCDAVEAKIGNHNFSDHETITISIQCNENNLNIKKVEQRVYSPLNIDTFANKLSQVDWDNNIMNNNDIDINISNFLDVVVDSFNESFPTKVTKVKQNEPCWMTNKIRRMVSHKKFLLRKMKKSNSKKQTSIFRAYNVLLRKEIDRRKHKFFTIKISNSSGKEKWRCINNLMNRPNKRDQTTISPNIFLNHFTSHFSSIQTQNSMSISNLINSNTAALYHTDAQEVYDILSSFKNKHSHHQKDIPMFLWKNIAHCVSMPIASLANQMILTSTFPQLLKSAQITPIFKKGNKELAQNYRPVTTLHNLSKVFEKIILNRIMSFCDKNSTLPNCQFGFRPNHSTKDAITSLFLHVENNLLTKKSSCCVFLDLSSAFDTVNHKKLIKILSDIGFRGKFNSLLYSFISNRQFCIKTQNKLSKYSPISRGVPQGSILSPMLYTLYVHNFNNVHPSIIQYADDTTLIIPFSSQTELNEQLNFVGKNLLNFLNSLDLILNIKKTEILIFGDKNPRSLTFLDSQIDSVTSLKFLGLHICSDRTFSDHIKKSIVPSIKRQFSFFFHCSKFFSYQSKLLLFNAYIHSHIVYAIPFINIASKDSIKLLNKAYNRALKCLFHLPLLFPSNSLPLRTSIPSLSSFIKKHTLIYAYTIFNKSTPVLTHSHFITSRRNNFILKPHNDKKSLHNTIAELWNSIHSAAKLSNSKISFLYHLHD